MTDVELGGHHGVARVPLEGIGIRVLSRGMTRPGCVRLVR